MHADKTSGAAMGVIWRGALHFGRAAGLAALLALGPVGNAWAQERVEISSPEELLEFFETLNYTPEAWEEGIREVPRAYLMEIGDHWRVNSQNIEVLSKKRIFFRTLGPLVLRANENILADRARLLSLSGQENIPEADAAWLRELAARYGVDGDVADTGTLEELRLRVDAVPPSLVLAQGAEESGWGTSRFAAEGNSLFGQWTWGGKGIKPKEQRAGLGDYQIAAFDTPLESVEAYLLNINSHSAYSELRTERARMRSDGTVLSGRELAKTLTRYSERGQDYVDSLHAIIRINKLQPADEAVLAEGPSWEVYPQQ